MRNPLVLLVTIALVLVSVHSCGSKEGKRFSEQTNDLTQSIDSLYAIAPVRFDCQVVDSLISVDDHLNQGDHLMAYVSVKEKTMKVYSNKGKQRHLTVSLEPGFQIILQGIKAEFGSNGPYIFRPYDRSRMHEIGWKESGYTAYTLRRDEFSLLDPDCR